MIFLTVSLPFSFIRVQQESTYGFHTVFFEKVLPPVYRQDQREYLPAYINLQT
jgi:hypothetical protein